MTEPPSVRVNRRFWDAISGEYQRDMARDLEGRLAWGPSCPDESKLRVLGDVAGKDMLDLACGGGQSSVWLARQGARAVVGVDASEAQLAHARAHAAREGVADRVRFVQASVTSLPMLEDASFDVALSAFALGYVEDLDAALREAWRLLRPGGLLAVSWSSPFFERTFLTQEGMVIVARPYWDRMPVETESEDGEATCLEYSRTYGDWLGTLVRAGFVVTDLLEPPPEPAESAWSQSHPLAHLQLVPGTAIWRARKPSA